MEDNNNNSMSNEFDIDNFGPNDLVLEVDVIDDPNIPPRWVYYEIFIDNVSIKYWMFV